MKHILNDLSEKEKKYILEQYKGEIKVVSENFNKLVNSKLGDAKPIINEQQTPFDVNNANDIAGYLNKVNLFLAAFIFKINKISPESFSKTQQITQSVKTYYSQIQNKSNDEVAEQLIKLLINMDDQFIPANAVVNKQNLKPYNPEQFISSLNSIQPNNYFVQSIATKNSNTLLQNAKTYNEIVNSINIEVSKQYKERVADYVNKTYPQQAESYIQNLNPSQKGEPISNILTRVALG